MTLKKLYATILFLVLLTIVVLFIFKGTNREIVSDRINIVDRVNETEHHSEDSESTLRLEKKEPILEGKFDVRWQKWVDRLTEDLLQRFLAKPSFKNATEAQIASMRKEIYLQMIAHAEKVRQHYPDGPPDPSTTKHTSLPTQYGSLHHSGPQTPEAIMETYDTWYNRFYPSDVTVEAKYPRAEWIQELLDMGITITTEAHYPRMMDIRYHLVRVEDNPEEWASGRRGVPPQDNFEDYKRAYIQRKVWESQQVDSAEAADPDVIGGFFFDNAPDVFLPGKKNRLYVHRSFEDGIPGVKMWGEMMTTKQRFDLIYRGEHPEGWEVIYLDKDYNEISEKPPHVTREMVRSWELPPEDWVPPEGITLPKGFEEDLRARGWKGAWTQQLDATEGSSPPDRATLAREAAEAERAAETEWKDFDRAVQEYERLANMSDAQLETEFQKMLITSLPGLFSDESIGKTLREKFSSTRFENAEKLLQEYGAAEGFRRLAEKDAELARQIEDMFGKRSAPSQKSGRFVPRDGRQPPPNAPQPPSEDEGK
ncbi:hypothetical protein C6501_05145 [Candidatus Poribacteria bacterium]|nr:MAG: hypothetical protein C6501_05145 [Candidatus Poribacteria bacterium]